MALSNSQYDAIMRVYNQRQFQDKREQDKRIAEVYEKVPQVEALSDEIAATMAQAARKILAGDRAAADQLKKDAEFLKEQKAVYLKQNGYPANYLELQYVCPDCKDTGYADGKKCHCFKHMEIEILYDQSNIREVLERENFDTLSMAYYDRDHVDEKTGMTVYDYMSKVIRECREYVEKFKKFYGSSKFYLFSILPDGLSGTFLKDSQKIIGIGKTRQLRHFLQGIFRLLQKCGGIGHPFLIDILRHRHFRLFLEFLTEGGHAHAAHLRQLRQGQLSVQMLVDIVQNLHQRILCSCTQRRLLESLHVLQRPVFQFRTAGRGRNKRNKALLLSPFFTKAFLKMIFLQN